MPPFIRYNVYLSPEQLRALHRIYDREGVKVSEQIRRALDVWLIKKGELTAKTRVLFKVALGSSARATGRKRRKR